MAYLMLQVIKKPGGMCAVHLSMMKLEGHSQACPEEAFAVSSPYQERVVVDTAVHAYGHVYVGECHA